MRTAKTLIRLHECPGWSVFAGCTDHFVCFAVLRLIWVITEITIKIRKNSDTWKITVIILKLDQFAFTIQMQMEWQTEKRGPVRVFRDTGILCIYLKQYCILLKTLNGILGIHACHISHFEIKSHRIWPIWKQIPIRFFKSHRIFRPSYNKK